MIKIVLLILLLQFSIKAQSNKLQINEKIISNISVNVTIIGLGDPTHQESTITKLRIDLIKKLVEERQFRIIAIEGNMYELYKAHLQFIKTNNISSIENAMYNMLNNNEMEELYQYVYDKNQKGDSIVITGFDIAFSGSTFVQNIKQDLNNIDFLSEKEKKEFINELEKATTANLKALFRNNKKVRSKIVYYANLILSKYKPQNKSDYFFEQALRNIVFLYDINETETSDNLRDIGMKNNIVFFKNMYKDEKIILFGSSTHLLKNPKEINSNYFQNNRKTLGNLLDKNYSDNYCFIAYSAISGSKYSIFKKAKKLPDLNKNSVEFQYKDSNNSPVFLTQSNSNTQKIYTRFLGHSFLEMNLWNVIDGLVLIQNIVPAKIKK